MPSPIKSFTDFKSELISNPQLQQQFKDDHIHAVEQISQQNL